MAKIPIDFKQIRDVTGVISKDQAQPIHVLIVVDDSAPKTLISTIRDAFVPQSATAFIRVARYADAKTSVEDSPDLTVIVAGADGDTVSLFTSLRLRGLDAVVVTADRDNVPVSFEIDEKDAINVLDVIAYPTDETDQLIAQNRFLMDLGDWIVDHRKEQRTAFANAFTFVRRPLAVEITKSTAVENAVIGAVVIIPGADMPVMTLNQIKMVLQIAAAYGQEIGFERASEMASVVAGGFACRAIARQAVGALPALGWVLKGTIGYSGTIAMGYACIDHFEGGGVMEGVGDVLLIARGKAMETASYIDDQRVRVLDERRRRREEGVDGEIVEVDDIVIEPLSLHARRAKATD